jgi:hypothetical protein
MSSVESHYTADFLPKLISELGYVSEVTLFSPLPTKPIQDRVAPSGPMTIAIDKALEFRKISGLPFWDCANLACFESGSETGRLLSEALFHNGDAASRWTKPIDWVCRDNLEKLVESLDRNRILILSSEVKLDSGEVMHIPMIDFHCPESTQNTALVEECMRRLNCGGGWIVSSGKSYHFYGRHLLSQASLYKFLAYALLLSPITDRAWIAHQIIEGSCGLRISKRPSDQEPPRIVSQID